MRRRKMVSRNPEKEQKDKGNRREGEWARGNLTLGSKFDQNNPHAFFSAPAKKSRRRPLLRTPFLLAACDGDMETMKTLYQEDPNVLNDVDVQGKRNQKFIAGFYFFDSF
jgi:hypothetical protein